MADIGVISLIHNYWNRAAFLLLLFSIVWAPLPFASQRPWAAALLAAIMSLTFLCCLIGASYGPTSAAYQRLVPVKIPLACLLCIQGLVLTQLIPLPPWLLGVLSPTTASFHGTDGWHPISLDRYATQLYLLKGVTYCLAFICVVLLVDCKRRFKLVCYTLIGSGLLQASYGSLMVLSGLEYGFFVEKYVGRGAATGTFINANHFAAYMIMCMSLAIGIIIANGEQRQQASAATGVSHIIGYLLSGSGLLRLAVAVMIVGLMLSHSRSANVFAIIAIAAGVGASMLRSKRLDRKLILLFVGFIVIDIVVVGQWFGLREIAQRLAATRLEAEDRGSIALMAMSIVRDFPLMGIGGGAFDAVFSVYKQPEFDLRYEHVHNDYIEVAAELGLIGALFFVIFAASTAWIAMRRTMFRSSRMYRAAGYFGVMVGVWLSLHSLTDFNIQITANALTIVFVFGLIWIGASLPAIKNR